MFFGFICLTAEDWSAFCRCIKLSDFTPTIPGDSVINSAAGWQQYESQRVPFYSTPSIFYLIGKYIHKTYWNVTKFQSTGGIIYTSFAKNKYFGGDLYSNLVAPHYNTDLLVETWQNGRGGKLPSNCSELTIENVQNLNLAEDPFKETEDHAKWAISKSQYDALVCIGDVNRMVRYQRPFC